MKRLSFVILITTMLFSLVSCGNGSGEPSETVSNGTSETSNGIAITDQTEETGETEGENVTGMQESEQTLKSGVFLLIR